MALHCPDCGFVNADGANYCQRCGHFLGAAATQEHQAGGDPTTATYRVGETGELIPIDLDDLGSLNGSYVNRRRIESHRLEDGDELQIGKYKLTFLQR